MLQRQVSLHFQILRTLPFQKVDIKVIDLEKLHWNREKEVVFIMLNYVIKSFLVAAKPSNSSRGELSSFFLLSKCKKRVKTVQTNMVAYVIWAINFKSEVRSDLRGCLEAIVASKSHFLCLSPIEGSS